MSLGPAEILVILVVALIVLGPEKLPKAGRDVAKFVREVRGWSDSLRSEINEVLDFDGEQTGRPVNPGKDFFDRQAEASAGLALPTGSQPDEISNPEAPQDRSKDEDSDRAVEAVVIEPVESETAHEGSDLDSRDEEGLGD